jgi:hypothetical protein
VDADYYGYRDDDDGVLAKLEAEVEDSGENEHADISLAPVLSHWMMLSDGEREGAMDGDAEGCCF